MRRLLAHDKRQTAWSFPILCPICVHAGTHGPAPLKVLFRSLENSAAQCVQQAEDLAVEVAQRRKAVAAAASAATTKRAAGSPQQAQGSGTGQQAAARTAPASHAAAQQVSTAAGEAALPGGGRSAFGQGLWWPGGAQQPLEQAVADLQLHSYAIDRRQDRSLLGSGESGGSSDSYSSGYSVDSGSDTDGGDHSSGAALGGGRSDGGGVRR